jgi:alpha-N-arabinofuranosidase
MYVPFQDAQAVPVAFDSGTYTQGGVTMPRVDAIAARGKDRKLWLAVTNLDAGKPARVAVKFAGVTAKSAAGEVLTAAKVDAVNSFEAPNTVVPKPIRGTVAKGAVTLELPGKSVAVVEVEG